MKPDEDGGPAFPTDHSRDAAYTDIQGGMTLLDYFAGQAIAGLVTDESPETAATNAYLYADAMIRERERAK